MFIVQQHCTQREFGISEYIRGRLIAKIEWVPLLKTEKLLWVMRKKTEKARIEWGGSHSILAAGCRCQAESRIEGRLPFYLVKKAALEGWLPFYPGYRRNPEFVGSAFLPG